MSKERLKETEQKYDMWADDFNLEPQDVEWLIEQVKRVQELEGDVRMHERVSYRNIERNIKLEQQNKRYQEALEFYADEESWSLYDHHGRTLIGIDGGMRARKTLGVSQNE